MWNREASPRVEGGQSPQTTTPAAAGRPLEERRVVAWVGKSVVFRGDLISSEDMTIDGRVEGTIEVHEHGLTIGPDADIRATIVARTVTIHGAVTGSITAQGTVVLLDTARVEGDIVTPKLAMADGAVVRGRVETSTKPETQQSEQSRLTTV